jgi:hypothetical protein
MIALKTKEGATEYRRNPLCKAAITGPEWAYLANSTSLASSNFSSGTTVSRRAPKSLLLAGFIRLTGGLLANRNGRAQLFRLSQLVNAPMNLCPLWHVRHSFLIVLVNPFFARQEKSSIS